MKIKVRRKMRFEAPEHEKKLFISYYKTIMTKLDKDMKKVIDEDTNQKTVS